MFPTKDIYCPHTVTALQYSLQWKHNGPLVSSYTIWRFNLNQGGCILREAFAVRPPQRYVYKWMRVTEQIFVTV